MATTQQATIEIDSSPEELFAIVMDLESYPEWVNDLQAIEILEEDEDGNPVRAAMTVDAKVRTASYTLAYNYDYPNRIEWVSEPGGDVQQIDGQYIFEELEDGFTRVNYELTMDLGFPIPGFMMKKVQKAVMDTALKGLKEAAEGE